MKLYILLFILLLTSISGFTQTSSSEFAPIPKGYYFTDIKGTTWLSSDNIKDSTLVDFTEMYLLIHNMSATDTISKNVWIFGDSLTIKFYDVSSMTYKTILTCRYVNNEREHELLLQLNSGREVTFQYTPVSTGNFVGFNKKKKKKN